MENPPKSRRNARNRMGNPRESHQKRSVSLGAPALGLHEHLVRVHQVHLPGERASVRKGPRALGGLGGGSR